MLSLQAGVGWVVQRKKKMRIDADGLTHQGMICIEGSNAAQICHDVPKYKFPDALLAAEEGEGKSPL